MNPILRNTLVRCSAACILLAGCQEQGTSSTRDSETAPATWLLASEPADARGVAQVKASVQEGDEVVLRGRIGGRKDPMSDSAAVFTVMDLSVPHCGQLPDDLCPTPWDYCCETPESITANAATIQVVDEAGSPVEGGADRYGLSALDEVIVVGTVGPRPGEGVLTVRASGVYRVK